MGTSDTMRVVVALRELDEGMEKEDCEVGDWDEGHNTRRIE